MNKQPLFVSIGELLWDCHGEYKTPGGAPANFACHSSAMGARCTLVSAIGDDNNAQGLLTWLEAAGVDTHYIERVKSCPTGTVNVTLDAEGSPSYTIRENVAWDFLSLHPQAKQLAKEADVICFGTLAQRTPHSRKAIMNFLSDTKEDCITIYDINLRLNYYSMDIITDSLVQADVLKINDEEIEILLGKTLKDDDEEKSLRELSDKYGLAYVVLTKGGKGGKVFSQTDGIIDYAAPEIQIIDTIGAGDSFTAAFAYGLINNIPLDKATQHAAVIAGYVCSCSGATPALPPELKGHYTDFQYNN